MTVTVLVADDHAQFRAMVAESLEDAGLNVVAQAATGKTAAELAMRYRPDVCLLDIRMPGDGIVAARRIATTLPQTHILMLTVSPDSDDVLDALQAGADGYLLKGIPTEHIADAVRAVAEGEAVIASTVTPALVHEIRRSRDRHLRTSSGRSVRLTEREWEILELLDDGCSTSDIAEALFVAPVTIRSHIAALMRKLEVRERPEAVALYRNHRPSKTH